VKRSGTERKTVKGYREKKATEPNTKNKQFPQMWGGNTPEREKKKVVHVLTGKREGRR